MAFFGNAVCTSYKKELLLGAHDFHPSTGHTFKIALYSSSASIGADTTAYTTTGEVTGTSYTAGGEELTTVAPDYASGIGFTNFENITITASVTARGALIYNSTPDETSASLTNPAVIVLDFGRDIDFTDGKTINMPQTTATTALVRNK